MNSLTSMPPGLTGVRPGDLEAGMALLLQAREYAAEVRCGEWEFAVELPSLAQAGVGPSTLRWLVHNGYLQHAIDQTPPGAAARVFHPVNNLTLPPGCCFILTEAGERLARSVCRKPVAEPKIDVEPDTGLYAPLGVVKPATPRWDADLHQLWCGPLLVKEFRRPAPHQELVLAAFDEEGWPPQIDDPLPGVVDIDPKRRLHDAIIRLNRSQVNQLLVFRGDGSGKGVRWSHRPAERFFAETPPLSDVEVAVKT